MDRLHSLPRLVQPYCMQPALLLSAYARHPPSLSWEVPYYLGALNVIV